MPLSRCIPAAVTVLALTLPAGIHAQVEQHPVALMPAPETAAGWSWDIEPEIYDPATLFEYINGEAEIYIAYDFIEMATGVHMHNDDILASVTFDIYDMGTPLNAFGIYSSFRRPGLEFDAIGTEAIVSDQNIRFWKGRFYVQVIAGGTEEVLTRAMQAHARALAGNIADAPLPGELAWLPAENRAARTLRYISTGFMGQEVFDGTLEAHYSLPGGECRAFVIGKQSDTEATAALAAFRESLERQGQITGGAGAMADRIDTDTEYYGRLAVRTAGRFVYGVAGFTDSSEADYLLQAIATRLRR